MTNERARRLLVRSIVPAAYLAIAGAVFAKQGVPIDRSLLTVWILGLLLCFSLGNLFDFVRSLLLEWLPLLAALTLYDILRGIGGGRVPIHGEFQIWIDRYVFGFGSVPSVWLQQHLWNPAHVGVVDDAAYLTYMSFFLATPVALGVLWLVDRKGFRLWARQLTLISFAAVACFTACPTIPPWLAAQKGMIGNVQRLVGPIGGSLPPFDGRNLWENGLRLANDLASFPSLHEGMTVLFSILLWRRVPRAVRPLLVAYPLAMAFSLVYLGEHYVCDLVAGAALAWLVTYSEPRLLRALQARLRRRRAVDAEPVAEPA